MNFKKLLYFTDNMGPSFSLTYGGEERQQTMTGGICGLLFYITMIVYSIYALTEFFTQTRYQSLESAVNQLQEAPSYNLVESLRMPFLQIYTPDNKPIKADQLSQFLNVRFQVATYSKAANWTYQTFRFMNCTKAIPDYKKTYGVMVSNFNEEEWINNYLCLNPAEIKDVKIQGFIDGLQIGHKVKVSQEETTVSIASIIMGPCDASLSLNLAFCNKDASLLKDFIYAVSYVEAKLDYGNYEKPVTYYLDKTTGRINLNTFTGYQFTLTRNTLQDDLGFPWSEEEKAVYTTKQASVPRTVALNSVKTLCNSLLSGDCSDFLQIDMSAGFEDKLATRHYLPILDVLGTIGGNKEWFYLFFFYLHMFFAGSRYKKFMVKRFYKIVPETSSWLCFKKKNGQIYTKDGQGNYYVPSAWVETAYENIMKNFDICTLSRELSVLRFMASALLRDYQLALIPLADVQQLGSDEKKAPDEEVSLKAAPSIGPGVDKGEPDDQRRLTYNSKIHSEMNHQKTKTPNEKIDTNLALSLFLEHSLIDPKKFKKSQVILQQPGDNPSELQAMIDSHLVGLLTTHNLLNIPEINKLRDNKRARPRPESSDIEEEMPRLSFNLEVEKIEKKNIDFGISPEREVVIKPKGGDIN